MIAGDFGLAENIHKYQNRLNELTRERKDVISSIKVLSRKRRMLSKERDEYLAEKSRKMVKIAEDGIPAKTESQNEMGQHHTHLQIENQQVKKVIEVYSNNRDRNKRLFGGLNSHLKKAENHLLNQSSKVKQKQCIEQKVIKKQKQEALKYEQQKRKNIEEELAKLNVKKQNNWTEHLKTENLILKNKFIAYVSDLQPYLFTKAQPSIAWKPYNQFSKLKLLKQESLASLKSKVESVVGSITTYNQKFDYRKYMIENQRQFCNNYLINYLESKKQFILTKSEPSICWIPANLNEKMTIAKKQSHDRITEVWFDLYEAIQKIRNELQKSDKTVLQVPHEEISDSESLNSDSQN